MRPPSLIRHPSATLSRPTRAAIGIRTGGNRRDAAANAVAQTQTPPQQQTRPPRPPRPPPPPLPFFSDLGLDRCSAARKDAALLAELSGRRGATAIVVRGGDALTMTMEAGEAGRGGGESGSGSGSSESGSRGSSENGKEDPDAPASPDLFLARLPLEEARKLLLLLEECEEDSSSPILLGVEVEEGNVSSSSALPAGAPLFAVALPRGPEGDAAAARAVEAAEAAAAAAAREAPPSSSNSPTTSPSFAFAPVRSEGPRMPPRAAAAAALAVGLSSFHSRARFDPATGAATRMASAGHARDAVVVIVEREEGEVEEAGEKKRDEKKEGRKKRRRRPNRSRPRVDPAVLVLASCRDHVLLGRKASWPSARYSLLAGFAELGETLEQAAERELAEEAGVVVCSSSSSSSSNSSSSLPLPPASRYLGSQPWPFPSSLMVAMRVDVDPLVVAASSLEEEEEEEEEEERGGAGGGEEQEEEEEEEEEEEQPPSPLSPLSPSEVAAAAWPSRSLPAAAPLDGELEDVRWFPAEVVREACGSAAARCGLRLPGRHALARTVLSRWAAEAAEEAEEAEASSVSQASPSSSSSPSSPSSSSPPPSSFSRAFFTSLFSSEAFPCVPRSLPESDEKEGGAGVPFELFRVRRGRGRSREEEESGGGGGGGGGETALALRWLDTKVEGEEEGEQDRERLIRAVELEAISTAGFSVEALGGGEIVFGRKRKAGGKGDGEEEEEEGAGSSRVPPEERRIVLRSSKNSSSSSSSSKNNSKSSLAATPRAATTLLLEVSACLVRRAHPLAEVAVVEE